MLYKCYASIINQKLPHLTSTYAPSAEIYVRFPYIIWDILQCYYNTGPTCVAPNSRQTASKALSHNTHIYIYINTYTYMCMIYM